MVGGVGWEALLRHVGDALRREGAVAGEQVRVPEQPREERGLPGALRAHHGHELPGAHAQQAH